MGGRGALLSQSGGVGPSSCGNEKKKMAGAESHFNSGSRFAFRKQGLVRDGEFV